MRKGLTYALSAGTVAESAAAGRRQLIAWSRPMDLQGDATDCGIMRVQGRTANLTSFMFVPNGHMDTESGDVIRADVQDVTASFISDDAATIDGRTLTGSRWRVASYDINLFVAWDPNGDPNQEGEIVVTDRSFGTAEDRWPATLSLWPR